MFVGGALCLAIAFLSMPKHDGSNPILLPFRPYPAHAEDVQLSDNGVCYVFVHPGFCVYTESARDATKQPELYGDYAAYQRELEALIQRVKDSRALCVYVIEDRVAEGVLLPPAYGIPHPLACRLVTRSGTGLPAEQFQMDGAQVFQTPQLLFDFLRANGVREIRVAGELAWRKFRYGDETELRLGNACVTQATEVFRSAGFQIRGVKGAVFPLNPPPADIPTTDANALYINPVTEPEPPR